MSESDIPEEVWAEARKSRLASADAAMMIDAWRRTDFLIASAILAERERAAAKCDAEEASMNRVADFLTPPRTEADPHAAEIHRQGAAVAGRLAAAIRRPG